MYLTDEELKLAKESLKKMDLFATCTDEEIDSLVNGLEKQEYKGGSTILFQGEISSKLCLVSSGKVCVIIRKGSEKTKVAELGAKSYFGEISLLTPRAATATVKAEDQSVILFLPGEIVQSLVKKNPILSQVINKKIDERLEASKEKDKEQEK